MSVIVVNTDPTWSFTDHVRAWALDLYPPSRSNVDFWDATSMRANERDYRRQLWGNWPQQLDNKRSVLRADLKSQLWQANRNGANMLVLIFILSSPQAVDERRTCLDRTLLEELADLIGDRQIAEGTAEAEQNSGLPQPAQPITNIWRIGLFRLGVQPTNADLQAGRDLVANRLLNTALFISVPAITDQPDECEFALLRGLMAMVGNERIEDILRADQRGAVSGVGTVDAPIRVDGWSEATRMRALMIRAVDQAKRAAKDQGIEHQQGELLNRFDQEVQAVYQEKIQRPVELSFPIDGGTALAETDWAPIDLGRNPIYHQGLEDKILKIAQDNRTKLAENLQARIEQWEKERGKDLNHYRHHEKDIVQAVKKLSAGLLGLRGSDLDDVIQCRSSFENEREDLLKQMTGLRNKVTQSLDNEKEEEDKSDALSRSLELVITSTDRCPPVRLRLRNSQDYRNAAWRLAEAAYELIHSPADLIFAITLALILILPVLSYAWGEFNSSGDWIRLWTRPLSHWWYMIGGIIVVFSVLIVIRCRRASFYRSRLSKLRRIADDWYKKANDILTAAINYQHLAFGISWHNCLIARLKRLEKDLQLGQLFEAEFDMIEQGREKYPWLQVDMDSSQTRYCNTVVPALQSKNREHWIRCLLDQLPAAELQDPWKAEITNVPGQIEIENRYLQQPFPIKIKRLLA